MDHRSICSGQAAWRPHQQWEMSMSAVHAAADGEAQWMALEWPCPGPSPHGNNASHDDISGGKAARPKAS